MRDSKTKDRFVELRAIGWSFERIANELSVSKTTLVSWSKDLSREIANLRALELDAIQKKYLLQKEQRLKFLGELLEKLHQELLSRKMAGVPTDKLIEIFLKIAAVHNREDTQVRFTQNLDFLDISTGSTAEWTA